MNAANEKALWGYRYTHTATTTTTNYKNETALVGTKNYSLTSNDYAKYHKETVEGDFEVEYTFTNYTQSLENWHNWAVVISTGGQNWYLRADAFSNSSLPGTTVNYAYNWNWDTEFKNVFKNKAIRVKISKIGTSTNVMAFVADKLVYSVTATNCPAGVYDVYLGGETSYLDLHKVSVSQLGKRQLVGTANDDGTYPAAFNTKQGENTTVTGDFELNYSFNNYHNSISTDNWDNFILKATSGSQSMMIRADAFALNVFGQASYTGSHKISGD